MEEKFLALWWDTNRMNQMWERKIKFLRWDELTTTDKENLRRVAQSCNDFLVISLAGKP